LTTSDLDPAAHRLRLSVGGEIDIATASRLFSGIIDAQPWPGDVVTLDMNNVTFMDSSGISMLLKVSEYLDGMGARLTLANPSSAVMRLLVTVGLTEHFGIDID
jgi:anti-sigma B factor antagonist